LSPQEWRIVFDTFDALGKGVVSIGKRHMTFQQVYDRHVESAYAEDFIAKLLAREWPEREAEAATNAIQIPSCLVERKPASVPARIA
jgi:hypothetical protein